MGLFDHIPDIEAASDAPVRITVRPPGGNAPEGFASNNRGFSTGDVQAAVRGDMFNSPGMPIKYAAQPGQTFGNAATQNAKPFDSIVSHHTGGPTLSGALDFARKGDPFTGAKTGYHFLIDRDGTVVQGAPMDARTNHVQPPGSSQRTGRPDIGNSNAVGISFVGDSSNPSPEQLRAAENLSRSLMDRYGIQPGNVVGHGQIQNTRQGGEGMPLVNALQNAPAAVAAAPQGGPQMGAVANAQPPPQQSKPIGLFDHIPDAKPDVGRGTAALEGYLSGASGNFRDEIYGASKASGLPDILGGFRAPVGAAKLAYEAMTSPGEATKTYEAARDEKRRTLKAAEEQYPGTYLAGQVGGAVVLPGGAAMQAATIPARIGRGAAVGATYGGVSGAGEGENAADRASRAALGTVLGGAVGGIAAPLVGAGIEKIGAGAAKLASPIAQAFRGLSERGVEKQAAYNVLSARARDAATKRGGLDDEAMAAARAAGQPVVNADRGGAATMEMARSAANTSSEARAALELVSSDRFATQAPRTAKFIKETFDFPDVGAKLEQIQEAARRANAPAYMKAYSHPNAQGIWDDGLEQFAQAPVVQQAIRLAFVTARNRGALEGHPPIKNPFVMNKETGAFELRAGDERALPNLQFWDHVKRNLDKMGGDAPAFSKALRSHLDDIVPPYKDARAGAATFFGAEDALDAGGKFATMSGLDALKLAQSRGVLAKMGDADRKLFETGFVANLIAKVESLKDGQDIVKNIFNSETARKQISLVLGADKTQKLEAHLLTERAMDQLRAALGNSTTARQLMQMAAAGATNPWTLGTAAGAATSYGSGNVGPGDAFAAGLVFAARKGQIKIDERVARRVGEMLASSDDTILKRGVEMVARNETLRSALRNFELPTARSGGGQAASVGSPMLQAPAITRAENEPEIPRPPGQ